MLAGALSGYRVLDVSHYIAGPYCTRLLAGYGAEVIKVERPGTGDGARRLGPFVGDDPHIEKSELFLYLNTGKKSITLNLKSPAGQEIFKTLVKDADILVENFEPRVMPSLGLGYDTLSEINPKLVMTSISNFGQTGPYRDYKAAEIVEYALSGLMKMTGESDREPLKLGLDVAQYTGGQVAVTPMLAAVYAAQSTNKGQHVDVSIMEYCTGVAEWQVGIYDAIKHITPRLGNFNQKGHPWGVFPCKDGWVVIATYGPSFKHLADLVGVDELKDPKFLDHGVRVQNKDEVDTYLLPWLLDHDKEYWIEHPFQVLNTARGAAAGWVRNTEDLVNCPQLASQGFYRTIGHPSHGKAIYPSGPVLMSKTPWKVGRAPLLGEDNEEIYGSRLGYTRKQLASLAREGVI
ncbi:MAG: CoA transferase [Deltaproteobacteria bacterium]|nr:CoA transferase [Deltaproteobacteria bacterium]MBW2084920.1 CoA transferase [Deltaproteobacteria bacterium]